jgi:hypothetical protein
VAFGYPGEPLTLGGFYLETRRAYPSTSEKGKKAHGSVCFLSLVSLLFFWQAFFLWVQSMMKH